MNNAQRVVVQLMGDTTNGAPTEREHRPPPASRLPSWVINPYPIRVVTCRYCDNDDHTTADHDRRDEGQE